MILRARVVFTMNGRPIENGAVALSGNRIADVGSYSDMTRTNSGETIDLGEQVLLPGLINTHCHLDYTCLRGKIPRPRSFTEWIRAINSEKAKLSADDCIRSINDGFAEARNFGATTVANLTAFPELVGQIHQTLRTWWFAELIDVRKPSRAKEIVELAIDALRSGLGCGDPAVAGPFSRRGHVRALQKQNWGLAPHAPFTASVNLYRRCEEMAERENVLLTTHLAESHDEMLMFRDAQGQLYQFLKEIGRDMSDCGGTTPLEQFLNVTGRGGSPDRQKSESSAQTTPSRSRIVNCLYLLTHLNELAETDRDLLARSNANFSIVHCPRSHDYFGHSPFQFEKLKQIGLNICLGTDSLASNNDLSLFAEMRQFQKTFADVSAEEILSMVTTNAARALRQATGLGKIERGFFADLIAVPCSTVRNALEEVIAFDHRVAWSMISGEVQSG